MVTGRMLVCPWGPGAAESVAPRCPRYIHNMRVPRHGVSSAGSSRGRKWRGDHVDSVSRVAHGSQPKATRPSERQLHLSVSAPPRSAPAGLWPLRHPTSAPAAGRPCGMGSSRERAHRADESPRASLIPAPRPASSRWTVITPRLGFAVHNGGPVTRPNRASDR